MDSRQRKRCGGQGPLLSLCFYLTWLCSASAQLTYSVSEELSPGSIVGNIAKHLDLTAQRIVQRNLRVVPDSSTQYFEVKQATGDLVIKQKIDREQLCELSPTCSLPIQILLDNPLEMLRVVVEILDVNDNAPHFTTTNISLEISEAASPGTRFRLESAHDPDVGTNSLRTYHLAANDLFILNVETKSDGSKFPELVLDKPLDRETQASFRLLLTAVDGGQPEKSGSTLLLITILDVNDNAPVFDEPVKKVTLLENVALGTLVTKLNATDSDSGSNGEVSFLFSKYTPDRVLKHFNVDAKTGEIRVKGDVDYEKGISYHITIQARDGGTPAMEGSCNVIVDVIDVNDNPPEVTLTSPISPIREDAAPDTVIALLSTRDLDSGPNGEVTLTVQPGLPFRLTAAFGSHYRLTTSRTLDRESMPEYTVVIKATDAGSPPLSSHTTFVVKLTDVNDNAPIFSQSSYSVDIPENNALSAPITTVSATDPDLGDNARISYSILPSMIQGSSISSYVYINPESGHIFSMRSLDHEQLNAFRIEVQAQDAGVPSRTTNVTVHVFVVDVNDNAPVLVHPSYPKETGLQLTVPPSAGQGHLINKLVAVDADSGHNAWLFYSIAPGPHVGMFRIAAHSGELRTAHKWADEETGSSYHITVIIQDNGDPPRSISVNITVTVDEKSPVIDAPVVPRHKPFYHHSGMPNITLYLIISLACVSGVSFITFVVLMVRCLRWQSNDVVEASSDLCSVGIINFFLPVKSFLSYHFFCSVSVYLPEKHITHNISNYTTTSFTNTTMFLIVVKTRHRLLMLHLSSCLQQKPPNNDWRFTQGQRPGPSGPGGPEVAMGTGPWPQPPTEAEQLQALMAAANAVGEATATLGPGTMGLSTRYSPQFTLQHVPDYRQNVYIPGSTATLTSNPQHQNDGRCTVLFRGNCNAWDSNHFT
uniref:Protocadherin gamma-C3 n=1 Tax=Neogobius melanostomus TaxID=47308 RepID=A0A8C6WZH1_9GOBI